MTRHTGALLLGLALLVLGPGTALAAPKDEQQRWLSASEADNTAAYTEFLSQYPEGTFSTIARIRLDQLNAITRYSKLSSAAIDQPPAKTRPVQSRTIVPRFKADCHDNPDAACVIFDQEKLLQENGDDISRLMRLFDGVTAAGDVKRAENYLRRAAVVARNEKRRSFWPAERMRADTLANLAATTFEITPDAAGLLQEALGLARKATSSDGNDDATEQRALAMASVARVFARTGQVGEARRIFAEAASIAAQGESIYAQIDIADSQARAGFLLDAIVGVADALLRAYGKPQFKWSVVDNWRYETIGRAEKALILMGQEEAALSIARLVGPIGIRLGHMADLRDEFERGAKDLGQLEKEIVHTAREAAKEKDAWIRAGEIGCAIARFESVKAGTMLARNLVAQAPDGGKTAAEFGISYCLAAHVGGEQAADYFQTTTKLRLQKKDEYHFRSAIDKIARAFIRSGDLATAREWANKLDAKDRKSLVEALDAKADQGSDRAIERLIEEKQFVKAIVEARKLERRSDVALRWIAAGAAKANDTKMAIEAARSMTDKQQAFDAYLSFLHLL